MTQRIVGAIDDEMHVGHQHGYPLDVGSVPKQFGHDVLSLQFTTEALQVDSSGNVEGSLEYSIIIVRYEIPISTCLCFGESSRTPRFGEELCLVYGRYLPQYLSAD